MESLMRFGRDGCRAVLEDFEQWVNVKGGNAGMDGNRNQIAYARTAKQIWFSGKSERHILLQDVWNNRIRNRDPARGCLRKVISMLYIADDNLIHLKRKNKWFCEARRHAGTYSHVPSSCQAILADSGDKREVGDRNEVVLFTTPDDQRELDEVFEKYYDEASKLFSNNRTKDQAIILVAYLQKLGFYPMRGIHAADWVARRKRAEKMRLCSEKKKSKPGRGVYKRSRQAMGDSYSPNKGHGASHSWSSTIDASQLLSSLSKPRWQPNPVSYSQENFERNRIKNYLLGGGQLSRPAEALNFPVDLVSQSVNPLEFKVKRSRSDPASNGLLHQLAGLSAPVPRPLVSNKIGDMGLYERSRAQMQLHVEQLQRQLRQERLQREYEILLQMQHQEMQHQEMQHQAQRKQQINLQNPLGFPIPSHPQLPIETSAPQFLVPRSLSMPVMPFRNFTEHALQRIGKHVPKDPVENINAKVKQHCNRMLDVAPQARQVPT